MRGRPSSFIGPLRRRTAAGEMRTTRFGKALPIGWTPRATVNEAAFPSIGVPPMVELCFRIGPQRLERGPANGSLRRNLPIRTRTGEGRVSNPLQTVDLRPAETPHG